MPERRNAVMCTKMSLLPSFGRTNPKPRAGSYHLTTPSSDSAGPDDISPPPLPSRGQKPPRSPPRSLGARGVAVDASRSRTWVAARPFGPCIHSKVMLAPSGASPKPERSSTANGKKTSLVPSSGTINPNPLLRLNHLILPDSRATSPGGGANAFMDAPLENNPPHSIRDRRLRSVFGLVKCPPPQTYLVRDSIQYMRLFPRRFAGKQ